jgi:hypothetical protein
MFTLVVVTLLLIGYNVNTKTCLIITASTAIVYTLTVLIYQRLKKRQVNIVWHAFFVAILVLVWLEQLLANSLEKLNLY